MSDPAALSSSPFWAFSLVLYADEAVAAACLDLQDRYDLDVNMLLFALFAASRGRSLSRAELAQLDRAVDAWRGNVVRPLRGVRRWIEAHAADSAARLRHDVLDREIEAEAFQQALMERTVPIGDGSPDARAAAANLERYAECRGLAAEAALTAGLATLLARFSAYAATAATSGSGARRG